jgi:predicted aconitase with swiveling domain
VTTVVRPLVTGRASGEALVLDAPLSLWGGVEVSSGRIVDHTHPQRGELLQGRIVALPGGRGSSSSSSVLAELLRTGRGPAGLVIGEPDSILVTGAVVARYLYGADCPVVVGSFPGRSGEIWEIWDDRLMRDSGEIGRRGR